MPRIAQRVVPFGTTIFTEINQLAQQHNALNLGQGRPDFDGPGTIIEAAVEALLSGKYNQYPAGIGTPEMREGVAAYVAQHYGLTVDAVRGVLVTPGATEAIFAAIMGLVDAGDEVIVVEPFFDSYVPGIVMAGAKPVYVAMRGADWAFDPDELRAAFTEKTRAIILNTPHNPTGRVYTRAELEMIAALCIEHDVTVISDEVYEHLLFDDAVHVPMAALPGMFERTITVGSAGKTFGMTGWKIGWAYGPNELIRGMGMAHQYIAFSANHPAQLAVAHAFGLDKTYYDQYRALYAAKREILMQGLESAGLKAYRPRGTYFIMADFSDVFAGDDVAFARHMIEHIGVACIPPTAFYSEAHKALGQRYVRFAFCKNDATLHQAAERMARLRRG
jgi:N-succinyldiaminopimelate aminotransferase